MVPFDPARLGLYLVTDEQLCAGRALLDVVSAAVQGGVSCVQLREKSLATRPFVERAQTLKSLLQPLGVPLIINDRFDIALACGADGVHVGQSDMPVAELRRLLPAGAIVGLSVESLDQLDAVPDGVDYLGVSPVFATPTKTDTAPAFGLDGLRAVRQRSRWPLVAIGGLHAGNAADVLAAGADGLAVVSAICAAADPAAAARTLRALIDTHHAAPR
ncbi:MAG: thiamine phosphate synthase [Pseudomonadota bacterium]|jgi:thiamine-phosphate pyrophosphorylase